MAGKTVTITLPREQMLSMAGFLDDMLTSLESDLESLQPIEQRLVGQLRNVVSKVVHQLEQTQDDESSAS